ncbi:MAG TPA: DHHA1 domain-containing protein [Methanospirillum sp.]|nr:DHHA1 domain-containing protein [Methanospirillum sp.]
MSIETAAQDMASELIRHDQVEILCHHDADGVAAGAIMSAALYRAHIPFRLRVSSRVRSRDLSKTGHTLLCDLGSGLDDLPEETMIIDHHLPRFTGPYHVNPRLDGIDGDTSLSAAGAAYLVANALGDNRDLAGLVLTGIIGDGQQLVGKNHEIFMDAMGNGIIGAKRGIRLPGRDLAEQLTLATTPFIPGVSGDESAIADLITRCTPDGSDKKPALDLLLSHLILDAAEISRPAALLDIYGDLYKLEREVIEDAISMTMVIDCCGKTGNGSLGAALCLRSSEGLEQAWEIARNHRLSIIRTLKEVIRTPQEGNIRVYEITDHRLASDIADTFCTMEGNSPVAVVARQDDGNCHLSIRAGMDDTKKGANLGTIVHTLAEECSGYGGGHITRAGATISCEHLARFLTGIGEAYA